MVLGVSCLEIPSFPAQNQDLISHWRINDDNILPETFTYSKKKNISLKNQIFENVKKVYSKPSDSNLLKLLRNQTKIG